MMSQRVTLTQYLIEQRRRFPQASGSFNSVILAVALACKALSRKVAYGALAGLDGPVGEGRPREQDQQKLDVLANETFVQCLQWGGYVRGLLSQQMQEPPHG